MEGDRGMEIDTLPPRWAWVGLGKIVQELESGSRPSGGVRGISEGVPSIGGEHLTSEGGIDFKNIRFVPPKFAESMSRGHVAKEDILIVKDGATTGKTAFVDDGFSFAQAVLNEHVFKLRVHPGVASQRYVFHFLRSPMGQEMIHSSFKGSAQGGINQTFVEHVKVPLAPRSEQERIVKEIERVERNLRSVKQGLLRVPAIMMQFRQSVLAKAFRGELAAHDSADGHFSKPLELTDSGSGNKPRDNPTLHPYPLPKNWAWTSFGREIEGTLYGPRFGKDEYTTMGTMTIRTTDMDDFGNIILKDPPRVKLNQKQKENFGLKSGDILITRSGSIGKCAIFEGVDQSAIPSAYIIRVRLMTKRVDPRYALYYLLSPDGQRLLGTGSHAITQQNINAEVIKKFPFPLAPIGEQIRIAAKIQELFAHSDEVESAVLEGMGKIREIEQASLAKAFRGELVSQDPNEEPASALLEGIGLSTTNGHAMRRKRIRLTTN